MTPETSFAVSDKKSFLDNAFDITKKYGLKIASIGFTFGTVMMAQKFFQGTDPHLFRNILAPAIGVIGCLAGFMGYERTNNTFSAVSAGILAISFAGADGDGFSPLLCTVNGLGVVTMGMGSHAVPKKKKQREQDGQLKSIAHDGKTQTASSQVIGNAVLLLGAIFGNKADMILPFASWTFSSVMKTTRAGLIARDKMRNFASHQPL